MPDQADKLRELVSAAMPRAQAGVAGPPMVAVTGGKGGVGATTVALNLAVALARRGQRVVLVDAARQHADLANMAGVHVAVGRSLGDLLAGRCSVADALVPGPAGTRLLADRWAPEQPPDWSLALQQRLLAELQGLGPCADVLVVDTGSGAGPWTARLWEWARLALVVTAIDDVAVMDTYATIKLSVADMGAGADVRVLVNQCDSQRAAADIHRRIGNVCRRFLGRTVGQAPTLPTARAEVGTLRAAAASATAREGTLLRCWESPHSPFGRSVGQLGGAIAGMLSVRIARSA